MYQGDEQEPAPRFGSIISFLTAIRFLTVLPISWKADHDGLLFPRSTYYFPLVGLLIGFGGTLLVLVVATVLPHQVAAFLLLLYLAAVTGFLHLDGLADSGDGLLSYRPREDSLRIMKDSRSGAMGVVVLILVLLGKYSALSAMNTQTLAIAALIMPLSGRCAILMSMAIFTYARSGQGVGGLFYSARTRKAAIFGVVFFIAVVSIIADIQSAILLFLLMVLLVISFGMFCRVRLGGVTGDTLGAVCEACEMTLAIGLAAGI